MYANIVETKCYVVGAPSVRVEATVRIREKFKMKRKGLAIKIEQEVGNQVVHYLSQEDELKREIKKLKDQVDKLEDTLYANEYYPCEYCFEFEHAGRCYECNSCKECFACSDCGAGVDDVRPGIAPEMMDRFGIVHPTVSVLLCISCDDHLCKTCCRYLDLSGKCSVCSLNTIISPE